MVNGKDNKDPSKRRKPKNNIVKSNSSFVSRVVPHENLTKRLQERSPDGLFAFANINRALQWLDLSAQNKVCLMGRAPSATDDDPGRKHDQDFVHKGSCSVS